MTIKTLFLALSASLAVTACSTGASESIPVIDLAAAIDDPDTENQQDLFSLSLALYPEVTDSTLIGRYMSMGGYIDGQFYIGSDRMMVFEPSGKCVASFDRSGQGPGEYGSYASFRGNPSTGGWQAFTGMANRMFSYTMTGAFIGCDTLPGPSYLSPLGDKWIGLSNSFDTAAITVYYLDKEFHLVDSLATGLSYKVFKDAHSTAAYGPSLQSNGSEASIYWNDTIYNVTDASRGCLPMAAVDLGPYRQPDDFDPSRNYERMREFIDASVFATDRHYLIWFEYDGRSFARFYERSSGKLVAALSSGGNPIQFDYEGYKLALRPTNYTTSDTFYFKAGDDVMSELTGDEDSNPALFALRLK